MKLSGDFRRGFAAILPLWLAAAPFAVTYVVAAQEAGIGNWAIQLMSLIIFSAAAQVAIVQLLSAESAVWLVLVTMVIMNLHHLLYGLSLNGRIPFQRWQKIGSAFLLTDAAYGVTIADEKNQTLSFLFGASVSMFVAWNLFTGVGLWLGTVIVLPANAHFDFAVPLTFFLLLVLVLRTQLDLLVAVISVGMTVVFHKLGVGNTAVLLVGILGPLMGLGLSQFQKEGVA